MGTESKCVRRQIRILCGARPFPPFIVSIFFRHEPVVVISEYYFAQLQIHCFLRKLSVSETGRKKRSFLAKRTMLSDHSAAALVQDVVGAYVGNREPADSVLKIIIGGSPRLWDTDTERVFFPPRYEPLEMKVDFFVEQRPRLGVARDVFVPQLMTAPMEEMMFADAEPGLESFGGGYMVRRWMSKGFATKVAFISAGETLIWLGKMAESYFSCFENYAMWIDDVDLNGAEIEISLEDVAGRGIIFHREIRLTHDRDTDEYIFNSVNEEDGEFRKALTLALAQLRTYVRA